jgi:hypothetical protein
MWLFDASMKIVKKIENDFYSPHRSCAANSNANDRGVSATTIARPVQGDNLCYSRKETEVDIQGESAQRSYGFASLPLRLALPMATANIGDEAGLTTRVQTGVLGGRPGHGHSHGDEDGLALCWVERGSFRQETARKQRRVLAN